MQTVNDKDPVFAQGDLFFERVSALPFGALMKKGKVLVISYLGHNHVITGPAELYAHPTDPFLSYYVSSNPVKITHKRTENPHETIQDTVPGIVCIHRQKEEGDRMVED